MSPELKQALENDGIYTALKRLHNYKRLRELSAPPMIVQRSLEQLEKSKQELGKEYEVVQSLYDEFRKIEEAAQKQEKEWEDRCRTCVFFDNEKYQYIENSDRWCRLYLFDDRTFPNQCPSYSKEEENN